jgi:hypothetical protein
MVAPVHSIALQWQRAIVTVGVDELWVMFLSHGQFRDLGNSGEEWGRD